MDHEKLLEPISDDQPCGPDMEEEGDDAFIDYYYEALARIPERFLQGGEPFDRTSIDLKSETAQIDTLLGQSRDLRLLSLEAKFYALAGRIDGFSRSLNGMSGLLREYWTDVHPQIGGGVTERRNQIELLDDRSTIVMPIEHAPLFRDRRLDYVSLRDYQVASGKKPARESEKVLDAGSIMTALRSPDNAEAVEKVFGQVSEARDALAAISLTCRTADSGSFAPTLGAVTECLNELYAFIAGARPDLSGEEAGETEDEAAAEGGAPAEDGLAAPAQGGTMTITIAQPGDIPSHAAAAAALLAVEAYYARTEPSSPGLLLVRQARKLIGRPLTEALDTLLPNVASYAKIDFGSETGFELAADTLRGLAADTYDVDSLLGEEGEIPDYSCGTRQEASALITATESFFRQMEPSSPVPVLLFKAKTYLNRDFSAIVSELFASMNSE
ncbi:ImpA family type VI secretion system protein [Tropicimonas sp. IMCC34011]|uniref:type VI secretion system protein TssA n=1 Tax=Tropicimonas sp. IMCC34011 TaxID=2248759 RepID=UPI000E22599D|nr:type VI secretion system ImpA family N-terminal domain-containing protein [Tropicimonas sp. IMCC34011]